MEQLDEASARQRLAEAETRIFGKNAARDADGAPMERGHGSTFQKMRAADKTVYLLLAATVAAEDVVQHSAALSVTMRKLQTIQREQHAASTANAAEAAAQLAAEENAAVTVDLADARARVVALEAKLRKN